jgi:hypothetical protein
MIAFSELQHLLNDNIISDHIKRLPVYWLNFLQDRFLGKKFFGDIFLNGIFLIKSKEVSIS